MPVVVPEYQLQSTEHESKQPALLVKVLRLDTRCVCRMRQALHSLCSMQGVHASKISRPMSSTMSSTRAPSKLKRAETSRQIAHQQQAAASASEPMSQSAAEARQKESQAQDDADFQNSTEHKRAQSTKHRVQQPDPGEVPAAQALLTFAIQLAGGGTAAALSEAQPTPLESSHARTSTACRKAEQADVPVAVDNHTMLGATSQEVDHSAERVVCCDTSTPCLHSHASMTTVKASNYAEEVSRPSASASGIAGALQVHVGCSEAAQWGSASVEGGEPAVNGASCTSPADGHKARSAAVGEAASAVSSVCALHKAGTQGCDELPHKPYDSSSQGHAMTAPGASEFTDNRDSGVSQAYRVDAPSEASPAQCDLLSSAQLQASSSTWVEEAGNLAPDTACNACTADNEGAMPSAADTGSSSASAPGDGHAHNDASSLLLLPASDTDDPGAGDTASSSSHAAGSFPNADEVASTFDTAACEPRSAERCADHGAEQSKCSLSIQQQVDGPATGPGSLPCSSAGSAPAQSGAADAISGSRVAASFMLPSAHWASSPASEACISAAPTQLQQQAPAFLEQVATVQADKRQSKFIPGSSFKRFSARSRSASSRRSAALSAVPTNSEATQHVAAARQEPLAISSLRFDSSLAAVPAKAVKVKRSHSASSSLQQSQQAQDNAQSGAPPTAGEKRGGSIGSQSALHRLHLGHSASRPSTWRCSSLGNSIGRREVQRFSSLGRLGTMARQSWPNRQRSRTEAAGRLDSVIICSPFGVSTGFVCAQDVAALDQKLRSG